MRQSFVDEILPKWKVLDAEAQKAGASDTDYADEVAPLEEKMRHGEERRVLCERASQGRDRGRKEAHGLYGDVCLSGAVHRMHPLLEKDLRQRIDDLDLEIEQLTKQIRGMEPTSSTWQRIWRSSRSKNHILIRNMLRPLMS